MRRMDKTRELQPESSIAVRRDSDGSLVLIDRKDGTHYRVMFRHEGYARGPRLHLECLPPLAADDLTA